MKMICLLLVLIANFFIWWAILSPDGPDQAELPTVQQEAPAETIVINSDDQPIVQPAVSMDQDEKQVEISKPEAPEKKKVTVPGKSTSVAKAKQASLPKKAIVQVPVTAQKNRSVKVGSVQVVNNDTARSRGILSWLFGGNTDPPRGVPRAQATPVRLSVNPNPNVGFNPNPAPSFADNGFGNRRVIKLRLVRCSRYSSTEKGCDPCTRKRESSVPGVRLLYPDETRSGMGYAAVDPDKIPFGSTIILSNGARFKAADIGSAVRNRTAAIELAAKEKQEATRNNEEYDYEAHAHAPVIDFFVRDGESLPDWSSVTIILP